jgi:hypothetical protein
MDAQNSKPKGVSDAAEPVTHHRWWWLAAATLLLIVVHAPVLRTCGRALLAEAAPQEDYDATLILGGDHRLQRAAELVAAGQVEQIWLIDGRHDYLVTAGILPASAEVLRNRLLELGVADAQIEVLRDPEVDDLPDAVRLLRTHLGPEPDFRLLVICSALSGRHVRFVLDEVLDPQVAARVAILGLPDDRFNVDQWWKSRSGLKEVFREVCSLGFTLAVGTKPLAPPPRVDAGAIERQLRRRFGDAACYEW